MRSKLLLGILWMAMIALALTGCTSQTNTPAAEPTEAASDEGCANQNNCGGMSYEEAVEIARNSGCLDAAQLKRCYVCNENTGTWWLDLTMDEPQPGCAPACVVDVNSKTAEINWRCTGALPPEATEQAPAVDPAAARDAALTFLSERYSYLTWPAGASWKEEQVTPEGLVGSTSMVYTAGDWVATVTYPLVAPEATLFTVLVTNPTTGFEWQGELDLAGQITEQIAPPMPAGEGRPVVAWYGRVVSPPEGSALDGTLLVLPAGTAEIGLVGVDKTAKGTIAELRDTTKRGHFWGQLHCDSAGGPCQLAVERVRPDGPGSMFDPEPVEGWEGVIYSGPAGPRSGGDDYLALVGDLQIQYGLWAEDGPLADQLASLRDSGTVVRVWGQLIAGIPDWNGTQIQASRFELVESPSGAVPAAPNWPEGDPATELYVNQDYGYQLWLPPAAAITEYGVAGFPSDELPTGMTAEQYLAQLQEQYGDQLCVGIQYGLGYIQILAPAERARDYAICGRTGVGAGEIISKQEDILIGGRSYTASGFEFVGPEQPCTSLECHNETMVVVLEDGTRVEYGSRPAADALYEDYLAKGKPQILAILASFQSAP